MNSSFWYEIYEDTAGQIYVENMIRLNDITASLKRLYHFEQPFMIQFIGYMLKNKIY